MFLILINIITLKKDSDTIKLKKKQGIIILDLKKKKYSYKVSRICSDDTYNKLFTIIITSYK